MEQQITNTKIVMPKKPTGMPNDSNFKIANLSSYVLLELLSAFFKISLLFFFDMTNL